MKKTIAEQHYSILPCPNSHAHVLLLHTSSFVGFYVILRAGKTSNGIVRFHRAITITLYIAMTTKMLRMVVLLVDARSLHTRHLLLQLPERLQMYSCM